MLTELRDLINDSAVDGVWLKSTLLGYLSEGQDKFCEETGYFTDITNYKVTLSEDVVVYEITDRAIQVMSIWNGTTRLGRILDDSVDTHREWPETIGATAGGVPTHWQTDQDTGFIKFTPTPTSDEDGDTLTLHLWRYSRYDLAGDGATEGVDAEPEIPSRFHRACIEWAAYKAFMHHDMEAQDPVKAADHKAAFDDYVIQGKRARRRIQNVETRVGSSPAYRT